MAHLTPVSLVGGVNRTVVHVGVGREAPLEQINEKSGYDRYELPREGLGNVNICRRRQI